MAVSDVKRVLSILPAWLAFGRGGGFLANTGWLKSRLKWQSIDAHGAPIPWITYSSLDFLQDRVRPEMQVFEYGSGFSTMWWAKKVRRVVSCEHDVAWYEAIRAQSPSNVTIANVPRDADHSYAGYILQFRHEFDAVVIDGRDRVRCVRNALPALKSDGVIIWDNSERKYYQPGFDFLKQNGFLRIDFTGMGPINTYGWSTSVFYRRENCLGI